MKTIKTNDSRVSGLIALYDMQINFFYNVLEGISVEDMHNCLNIKANRIGKMAS